MSFFDKVKSKLGDMEESLGEIRVDMKEKQEIRQENMANMEVVAKLKHLEGLKGTPEGIVRYLKVVPQDNKLYISVNGGNENAKKIDLDEIHFIETMNMKEIEQKKKSVVGRAVVGGLLGPIGAVVGGISGVGSKNKSKNIAIMIISYGDDEHISFANGKGTSGYSRMVKKLREYTN